MIGEGTVEKGYEFNLVMLAKRFEEMPNVSADTP
jgi:hypothetical protein